MTNGSITNGLEGGNATIKGVVSTEPGGTVDIGPSGSVGDKAWVEGGSLGIQPGHLSDDRIGVIRPASLPSTTWLPAGNFGYRDERGHTYKYALLVSGDYTLTDCSDIYVGSNALVRLKVTGNVVQTNSSQIRVATGGMLKLYMVGTMFTLLGNGILNDNYTAFGFSYFGLSSNTTLDLHQNAPFTGFIYAPTANFTIGSGATNAYDFIGAVVAKSVRLNGNFNFHFDENLYRSDLPVPPVISRQPTNQTALAGSDITLTAAAMGVPPPHFQWLSGAGEIGGATNSSLLLSSAQHSDSGSYFVVVTNVYGASTSTVATVSIYTPAAALEMAAFSSNTFQMTISGVQGLNYAVEASTNLTDWIPLVTNGSPFTFSDPDAAGFPQRYYRSVYVP